jgi:glucose-1-phosphate cytidylyltransferase
MTGGRLKRVRPFLDDDDFCFTYGDGLSSLDIKALVNFHRAHGKLATVTAVRPPGRFGSIEIEGPKVASFLEKPKGDGGWINGGFFVLKPAVLDLIEGDQTVWEDAPLHKLIAKGELNAFVHTGFWEPMDTLRDRFQLEHLWASGEAPWKVW